MNNTKVADLELSESKDELIGRVNTTRESESEESTVNEVGAMYNDYDDYDTVEGCDYFAARELVLNSFFGPDVEDKDASLGTGKVDLEDASDLQVEIVHQEMPFRKEDHFLLGESAALKSGKDGAPTALGAANKVAGDCDVSVFIMVCVNIYFASLFI